MSRDREFEIRSQERRRVLTLNSDLSCSINRIRINVHSLYFGEPDEITILQSMSRLVQASHERLFSLFNLYNHSRQRCFTGLIDDWELFSKVAERRSEQSSRFRRDELDSVLVSEVVEFELLFGRTLNEDDYGESLDVFEVEFSQN